jgi:hypothetical protein
METQNMKKPQNDFIIIKTKLHLVYQHQLEGGYNPLDFPAPTPYIYHHQLEGSTNSPYLPTLIGRRLQPPRA